MLHPLRLLAIALLFASAPAFPVTDNIILFVVDDLRVDDRINTPNIDNLAAAGTRYTSAYVTGTYCLTSRTGIMFGMRAEPLTRAPVFGYPLTQAYKDIYDNPEVVSLPEVLSAAGYLTAGTGKVFHDPEPDRWDIAGPETVLNELFDEWGPGPTIGIPHDKVIADWADDFIRDIPQQPFFLAVGLYQPHTPRVIPSIDYPEISGYIAHPNELDHVPDNVKDWLPPSYYALFAASETLDNETRAYMSAATYTDMLIGQVVQALHDTGQTAHIIIVSDNGYHLGEKAHWGKNTFWEQTMKVPLVIVSPDYPLGVNDKSVSLLDLAPTILAMADVAPHPQFEGMPLLNTTTPVETNHQGGRAQMFGKLKVIDIDVDEDDPDDRLIYNLSNDPGETVNIAGSLPGC